MHKVCFQSIEADTARLPHERTSVSLQLQTASNAAALVQQSTQLANCVTSLLGIEECLRQLLTHSTAPKTMTETAAVTTRTADSPISGNSGNTADAAGQLQLPKLAGLGDVSSHVIQTVSTRYDMNSGLMTKACAPEPPAQLEPILQQLQALIPLVKAAAATVAAAGIGTSSSPRSSLLMQRKGSGLGGIQSEDAGASSSSEAPESPKMSSSNAPSPGPEGSSKCRKCESIKPLLAIMQKVSGSGDGLPIFVSYCVLGTLLNFMDMTFGCGHRKEQKGII